MLFSFPSVILAIKTCRLSDFPILIMTGKIDKFVDEISKTPNVQILEKPFNQDLLDAIFRKALERPAKD